MSFKYSDRSLVYTPPSSPPSSPSSSSYTHSSSPLSSPTFRPEDLRSDDIAELTIGAPMDPLAGSYHTNMPRKRPSHAFLNSPPETPSKKARFWPNASPFTETTGPGHNSDAFREKILWEDAIETVFETGERKIDLVGKNISHIPPHVIRDLAKIVVLPETGESFEVVQARLLSSSKRPFTRTRTAPASTIRLGKTVSSNSVLGVSRETVDLLLGQNNICKLPVELWRLHDLTLLSLRNNNITYLPPQIAQLTQLQSLNVAHNKLRFIPSELLSMKKLKMLFLFPNPYLPKPSDTKVVSETKPSTDRVSSLAEMCLRRLLSPPLDDVPSSEPPKQTRLEHMYELPLASGGAFRPISSSLRHILDVCVPGSVFGDRGAASGACSTEDEAKNIAGTGTCPNPAHGVIPSVFVHHAEERFTWETSTPLVSTLGGSVAVHWRGCMRGCLDFLEPPKTPEPVSHPVLSPSDDMHLDDDVVVQTFSFAAAPLGFE